MLTQRNAHFFADKKQSAHLQHDHHWPLADLVSVQRRRYLLRNSALEIFLLDNSSYFVNFPSKDKVSPLKPLHLSCLLVCSLHMLLLVRCHLRLYSHGVT